jgi:MFS family permease
MLLNVSMDDRAVQRRIVRTLVIGQVLAGLGQGATGSLGAVLATSVSGSEAWAGSVATASTLGAAAIAIPLARLAQARGRRVSLATGALIAATGSVTTLVAVGLTVFPLLLLGFAMLGVGAAVGLQARFAATDNASTLSRGRDLSIVVWSTTVGAVVGPNLFGPGVPIAQALHLPDNTGSFAIAVAAQLLAAAVYAWGLRPDPLLLAQSRPVAPTPELSEGGVRGRGALVFAIVTLGFSHATMVSVMSMTPVHLVHQGADLTIIGFTISLHIAGMFGLSPVFGLASDRVGRIPTILLGQVLFFSSLFITAIGEGSTTAITVGLVLLGLGWSASTVAASALVSDLASGATRVRVQGRADLVMSLAGAAGAALAGPVLAVLDYDGLSYAVMAFAGLVVVGAFVFGRPRVGNVTGS